MASGETKINNEASLVLMRLKILYTFDSQNRINHLTRWPHVLSIRKIIIDQTAVIGVTELGTCIQAIIEASPELITDGNHDYTVYAYDISESDYPLVGQGLLSKILPVASSPLKESSNQHKKLVTGRVVNDIHGIFTSDVKETLEVKIRLVPLPTLEKCSANMICSCEESNHLTPGTSDCINWKALMQLSSALEENIMLPSKQQLSDLFEDDMIEGSGNESTKTSLFSRKSMKASKSLSKISLKRGRGHKSKVSSVAESASSYEEVTDGEEPQAPKKRAKVQKAQWNTGSTFGQTSNSLRVAAGTSGSLRLFRPVPINSNHNKSVIDNHEDSLRVPTPTPRLLEEQQSVNPQPHLKLKTRRNSNLSQDSSRVTDKTYDLLHYTTESADTSPERNQSPFDTENVLGMTSSPPIMKIRTSSHTRSSPPCPSSPCLPQLPRLDSGFMSGSLENFSGELDDEVSRGKDAENLLRKNRKSQKRQHTSNVKSTLKQRPMEFIIEEECPGPMDQLPTKMPIFNQQARARSALSRNNNILSDNGHLLPSSRRTSRAPSNRIRQQCQPLKYAPDPENSTSSRQVESIPGQFSKALQFSQTTLPATFKNELNELTNPASDPILPYSNFQNSSKAKGISSIQTNAMQSISSNHGSTITTSQSSSKKEMIKQKLENAIANGEMPPFCCNCGAIETPTWRKAWSKEIKGEPGYYEYSDEPGRVTAIIILSRDHTGKPTSYNLIKKYLGKDENQDDYNEYLLCNPCGIWMSKYKTSRPEERWESNSEKSNKIEPKKRPIQRVSRSKKTQNSVIPTSVSETNYLPSDASHLANDSVESVDGLKNQGVKSVDHLVMQPKLQPIGPSDDFLAKSSVNISTRLPSAIQSSPIRSLGTRQSPIELEDNLGCTRRLLFPSPVKDGISMELGEAISNSVTRIRKFSSATIVQSNTTDEENRTPQNTEDDMGTRILQLFGEEKITGDSKCPKTPAQKSSTGDLFTTPTRSSPTYRLITHSVSRSAHSIKSSEQLLELCRTPGSAQGSVHKVDNLFESPFTTTLNQLFLEAKKANSPTANLDLANPPTLSEATTNLDMNVDFSSENFFSTEMLSSNTSPDFVLEFNGDPIDCMTDISWQDLSFNFGDAETSNDTRDTKESELKLKENIALGDKNDEIIVNFDI